ncbi:unnamed protein product [Didymodactylos carnosus]|uniref:Uncharacterized protein n=1 Tax=Didymodactylos carnosus TaxID=1234261 RepID=A0A813S3I4_9BILA|nr:unnamed protein product [Didymodactylos carnosus]CAF0811078.1 unnamed protein product [Didymodactylos carnosus]CAF3574510.1 unnamed protein product [Didymodactylos carnosus]CAF3594924.1 unnamed protein product [Didymodactylos carnosus]
MVVDIINDQQHFNHLPFTHHQHRTNTRYEANTSTTQTRTVLANDHHHTYRLTSDSLSNKAQKILGPPNAAFKQNSEFNDYPQTNRLIIESSTTVPTRDSQIPFVVNNTSPLNVNVSNISVSSESFMPLSKSDGSGFISSSNIKKRVPIVEKLVPLILKLVKQPKLLPNNVSNVYPKRINHNERYANSDNLQLSEPSDNEVEDNITVKPQNVMLNNHNRLSKTDDDESEDDAFDENSNQINENQQNKRKCSGIIHHSLSRDDSNKLDSDLQHSDMENEEDHLPKESNFSLSFFVEKQMDMGYQNYRNDDDSRNTNSGVRSQSSPLHTITNESEKDKDEKNIDQQRTVVSVSSTGFLPTSNNSAPIMDESTSNSPSPSNLFVLPPSLTSSAIIKSENSESICTAPMSQMSISDEDDISNYMDKKSSGLNEIQVDNKHSEYSDPGYVSCTTEQVNSQPPNDADDNSSNNNTTDNLVYDLEISSSDDDEHEIVLTKHRTKDKSIKNRRRSTLLSPPSSSSCSPLSSPISIEKLIQENIIVQTVNNNSETKTSPKIKQETPPPSVVSSKEYPTTKRLKIDHKIEVTQNDIRKSRIEEQWTVAQHESDKITKLSTFLADSSAQNDNCQFLINDHKQKTSPKQQQQELLPVAVSEINDENIKTSPTSHVNLSFNSTVVSPPHRKMKRLKHKDRHHREKLLLETFSKQLVVNTKIDTKHPILTISIPLRLFKEKSKRNELKNDEINNDHKSNSSKRNLDGFNRIRQSHLEDNEVNERKKITDDLTINKKKKTSHYTKSQDINSNNNFQTTSEHHTFKNTNEMKTNNITNNIDSEVNVNTSVSMRENHLTNDHSSPRKPKMYSVSVECNLLKIDKPMSFKTCETQTTESWHSSKLQQQQPTPPDMMNKTNYTKLKTMKLFELDSLARQRKKLADGIKRLTSEQMMLYSESVCYFILCAVGEKNIERRSGLLKETLNMLIQCFNQNRRFTPTSSCPNDPLIDVRPKFLLICYWLQSFLYHLCFNVNMPTLDHYMPNVNDFLNQVRSLNAKNNTTTTTTTTTTTLSSAKSVTASGIVQMTPGSDNPISPASNISTNSQASSTNTDTIPNIENNRNVIDYSKIMMYSYHSQVFWNKVDRHISENETLKEFVKQLQRQNCNRRLSRDDNPHDFIVYIFNAIELMRSTQA